MIDRIEVIGQGTLIQHGELNDRVYVMKIDKKDARNDILRSIAQLAHNNRYSKIFCKVPKTIAPLFTADGYILEAEIPQFYDGKEDVFFMSKFLNSDRLLDIEKDELKHFSELLSNTATTTEQQELAEYSVRPLSPDDANAIVDIYTDIFDTYPFPIHKPEYILETMKENVQYFGVEINDKIVALSSADIDPKGKNAEMTDFATHPLHTGHHLSVMLLQTMEKEMKAQGINCLYTIARLKSIAMNKTFIRNGYHFSGTLIKNTNIAGKIESMNIYYKHL